MNRALLVYSKENNRAFILNGHKNLLRLIDNGADYFDCIWLVANINDHGVDIKAKDTLDVFGNIHLSFSGEHMIVWEGE